MDEMVHYKQLTCPKEILQKKDDCLPNFVSLRCKHQIVHCPKEVVEEPLPIHSGCVMRYRNARRRSATANVSRSGTISQETGCGEVSAGLCR
jgi:hypothetical protein